MNEHISEPSQAGH